MPGLAIALSFRRPPGPRHGRGPSAGCAYATTLGGTDDNVPSGRVTVRDDGGRVGVQTYDPATLPICRSM